MNVRANKYLLLATSLATLLLLLYAAFEENVLREWRRLQATYRERISPEDRQGFAIQLRQVVVPALDVTDRCVTCHVGMAPGETGIPGDPVYGPHPKVVHDPAEYGCVVCHGGQGRATETADAHGNVPFWPEPMLPRGYEYAGCGTCHTHLRVPSYDQLMRGRALLERYDCLTCHAVEGRGGTIRPGMPQDVLGPDLSRVGMTGYDRDWYAKHLARHDAAASGPWRDAFDRIPPQDLEDLGTALEALVGAPGLLEAKALFHSLGCRGCHKVGGVGGDDGPDLTRVGQKDPGRIDWSGVRGPHTLENWFAEHFRSPARVVAGSLMPELGLTEEQIRSLTFYMFSLRRSPVPEAYWPKDRIRAERFGEREFATDGATLYGTFCASCHGARGEGMRYPGMAAFPAIANPDFLALAPDSFLVVTVRSGRPGRRMPAWGEKEGGLRPEEILRVVAYVRDELGGGVRTEPDPRPARWVRGDPERGRRIYQAVCSGCHGPEGEGNEGPALAIPVFLRTATDTYLVETIRRGRRGTSMPGFSHPSPAWPVLSDGDIEDVVAFLRTWEETP
jgi:cbb3-type cytochrome c oxidase subunit III